MVHVYGLVAHTHVQSSVSSERRCPSRITDNHRSVVDVCDPYDLNKCRVSLSINLTQIDDAIERD